jgi:hypothetical protein
MKTITINVQVPDGDSCRVREEHVFGMCRYYKSRACVIFNAVIVDFNKCKKCLTS